jgi:hypothetical protein
MNLINVSGYLSKVRTTGFQFLARAWILISAQRPDRLSDQPSLLPNEHRRLKRPEHVADHSPSCSTEIKNIWTFAVTTPFAFMAWNLRIGATFKLTSNNLSWIKDIK